MAEMPAHRRPLLTGLFTASALVAFAANSILCRLALGEASIDAASFSTIRLAAGALLLLWLVPRKHTAAPLNASSVAGWVSPSMLALYAIAFSFAYRSLTAATGALILFASVQVTMLLSAVGTGERPSRVQWAGLTLAMLGLVYLVLPGLEAPDPAGSALMALAGVGWGVYSLRGRGVGDPEGTTRDNFALAVPLALAVSLLALPLLSLSLRGTLLAATSGAVTSGLGYVLWYRALAGLSATVAASVQLAVPVLTALAGVALLAESLTLRLVSASVMILGGIALSIRGSEVPTRPLDTGQG